MLRLVVENPTEGQNDLTAQVANCLEVLRGSSRPKFLWKLPKLGVYATPSDFLRLKARIERKLVVVLKCLQQI
jgi:hypothetical protein